MAFKDKIFCSKCGAEYSILKSACPNCNERNPAASNRTAPSSEVARRNSAAQKREAENVRWQMIFGLGLVVAVIVAVIILITSLISETPQVVATPDPTAQIVVTPPPTPEPTPEPTPTVESLSMTFMGQPLLGAPDAPGFSVGIGGSVQLGYTVYPLDITEPVKWTSLDPNVCTVDDNGLVTGVGSGSTKIVLSLYGASYECSVWCN